MKKKKTFQLFGTWTQPEEARGGSTGVGSDMTPMHILCISGDISKPQIY